MHVVPPAAPSRAGAGDVVRASVHDVRGPLRWAMSTAAGEGQGGASFLKSDGVGLGGAHGLQIRCCVTARAA